MREKLIELLGETPGMGWSPSARRAVADHLVANGVTVSIRCRECKHWTHTGGGWGDCTNRRFHLDGHCDPTMQAEEYCCLGEMR